MDDTIAFYVIGYVVFGAAFLWLSVRLSRRIRSVMLRAAISAGVFALWFSPGGIAGEGGAAVVPLWMAVISSTSTFLEHSRAEPSNPWPLHYWRQDMIGGIITLAILWSIAFAVILCIVGIRRWLRKDESAAQPHDRLQT
jgi:hypothetical protein